MKKLSSKIFLILVVFLMPGFTLMGFSQQVKTFNVQKATLEQCLKQIENQTGLGYLSKGEDIREIKNITYSADNKDVRVILKDILSNTGFTFEIDNGVILILKAPPSQPIKQNPPKGGILTLKINDYETGDPLVGASALIRQYGAYGIANEVGLASIKNLPG
jgi:hypothetical protein